MIEAVASKLVEFEVQLRFLHWQTNSYSQHIAFGEAHDTVQSLNDEIVEMIMGKYGRVPFVGMEIKNIDACDIENFIVNALNYLQSLTTIFPATDSDILNKRDELVAAFSKLAYLVTLS